MNIIQNGPIENRAFRAFIQCNYLKVYKVAAVAVNDVPDTGQAWLRYSDGIVLQRFADILQKAVERV